MTKPTPGSAFRRAPGVLASIGAVAVGLAVASARPAQAAGDQVLIWNDQTTRAIEETAADPFQASRALALESIAVLDTAKSIAGAPAFLVRLPGSRDLKADIAVAAAAHEMLNRLFPARRGVQDALLNASLSDQPAGPARDRALAFGKAVADAVFARREGDGWKAGGNAAPAQWRPTRADFLPPLNPRWGFVTPFALLRPNQFRPPASGSEVAASPGTAQLIEPTAAQTEIARDWSDSAGASGPPAHWNAIASSILGPSGVGLEAEAELFAALNVAMADAGVAIVDAKSSYRLSRPVTGIQQVATGAPLNQPGDMAGHSGFSGAAAAVLTARLGTREFSCASATESGVARTFESFQQAAEAVAASRVSGGIHTSFDNEDGLATGRAVGTWTLAAFRRLAEDRGPVIIMDPPAPAGSQTTRGPSGYAVDNYAPVKTVNVRVNGGERFNVAIDDRGRFTLPRLHPGQFGQTDVMLMAISPTGRIATARLTIDGDAVDSVVTIPLSVQ